MPELSHDCEGLYRYYVVCLVCFIIAAALGRLLSEYDEMVA